MVAADGAELRNIDESYRRDPDVVLAAVAGCPEALRHAAAELRRDPDFALEVASRSPEALEYLPEDLRAEHAAAALAASRRLSCEPQLPDGPGLVVEAGAGDLSPADDGGAELPPRYEGEHLRLVGFCNEWRTTDSKLRFQKVQGPGCRERAGDSGNRSAVAEHATAVRHRLTARLQHGCLSFQAISCTRDFSFRVYPRRPDQTGFFTLRRGDPSAVPAATGGGGDGHGKNFYIREAPGTVVSIFVELAVQPPGGGQAASGEDEAVGVCQAAAVWHTVETDGSKAAEAVVLVQSPSKQRPVSTGAEVPDYWANDEIADSVEVLADVDPREFRGLVSQARSLGSKYFEAALEDQAAASSKGLTLARLRVSGALAGYLLYQIMPKQVLFVDQLAVSEDSTRRGVGSLLLRWAVARADAAGCTLVRLKCPDAVMGFYLRVGFREVADSGAARGWACQRHMEMRV